MAYFQIFATIAWACTCMIGLMKLSPTHHDIVFLEGRSL
jgi:hypothetical protein